MIDQVITRLSDNGFVAFAAHSTDEAREIALRHIREQDDIVTVSYGDSMTVRDTGLFDAIKANSRFEFIEVFPPDTTVKEKRELQKAALHADLFITGSNAVTRKGQLVNLDSIGNRVAGITFGPRYVIIMVGRNKIVPDLDAAIDRVKNIAAPLNTKRLKKNTPCTQTGQCEDCDSDDRICITWVITEKSKPAGRICVIVIDDILGL